MNQMGYGPKTNTTGLFPISLQTGQSWVIPSGQYIVQLGPYTVIQTFDAVTQTWRIVQTPANSDIIQISSDGYNWRVINITGTVVGAYVVNGGTSANITTAGIYPAGTVQSGAYAVATTTAGAQSSVVGTAATFNVIVGGAVSTTVAITTPGAGYTRPPTLLVSAPPVGGVQCTMSVTALSGGGISTISVTNQGAGYTAAPTVTVVPNPLDTITTPAVLTPAIDANFPATGLSRIAAVTVAYGGSGYAAVPTITAAASGSVTGVSITPIMCMSVTSISGVSGGSANQTTNTGVSFVSSQVLASAKTNATTNPFIEAGAFTPRIGWGTAQDNGAGTWTGVTMVDGGLHQLVGATSTVTRLTTISQWTTAAPTSSLTGTVNLGGNVDTIWIAPV